MIVVRALPVQTDNERLAVDLAKSFPKFPISENLITDDVKAKRKAHGGSESAGESLTINRLVFASRLLEQWPGLTIRAIISDILAQVINRISRFCRCAYPFHPPTSSKPFAIRTHYVALPARWPAFRVRNRSCIICGATRNYQSGNWLTYTG